MATTRVEAEFQDRRHIIFTARERSAINVRVESADGGPVGMTSYELLLMALANCTLGVVMGHQSLENVPVTACRAVLEAESGSAPSRVGAIRVKVEVEVPEEDARLEQTLQRVADACPIGNTLKLPPELTVELKVVPAGKAVLAGHHA